MPHMREKAPAAQRNLTTFIGPVTTGAGYAVSKIFLIRWLLPEMTVQIDFKLFILAGFFLGIIIRPIFQRIYWYRSTAFVWISFTLLLMGHLGSFPEYFLDGNSLDSFFWAVALIETIPLLVVTIIASLILLPSQHQVTLSDMRQRLEKKLSLPFFFLIGMGAFAYVFLFLTFRVGFQSLDDISRPLQNLQSYFEFGVPVEEKLFYLWLQGVVLIIAMIPIHSVIRGKPHELTLILGTLLFVIKDFVPLFAPIDGQLPHEMLDQIIQRLFIDAFFCYTIMLMFAKLPIHPFFKQQKVE